MQTQQDGQQQKRPDGNSSFPWMYFAFVLIAILFIAIGVSIWIYLSPEVVIPYALLTGLSIVLALLQTDIFSSHKTKTPTNPTIILSLPQTQDTPLHVPSTDKIINGNQSFPDRTTPLEPSRPSEAEKVNLLEPLPLIWNVPYQRNPFFTGREDILHQLYDALRSNTVVAMTQPQAISGLGGIGKTQIASEYAYRYHNDYQLVLWVRSSSREELIADYVTIAGLLDLPEKNIQNQSVAVGAVKRWLETHPGWLLIFDNADDLAMVRDYLPFGNIGHILLTTRSQTMSGLAQRIEVEKMELEDGVLFLLRRVGVIMPGATLKNASETDRAKAIEIVQAMDGLPLALDQAGAYIEETKCSLSSYLTLYRTHRAKLLNRRGGLVPIHPEPVATTWSLSFEKVEQANSAAVELLRLCSFLAPDAIPEEILTKGAPDLSPVLHLAITDPSELNTAIGELLKYSLIYRDPYTQTFTIHRLVQAVFKDAMDDDTQRLWAERTVKAVNRTFPKVEFESWSHCQRLLSHAQVCRALIEEWDLAFPESAQLLQQAGHYLLDRTQYLEAEPFVIGALTIREKVLGPEHPDTATSLNDLTWLYQCQGKYEQAEIPVQRALAIREKVLGPDHPDTATSLNDLAWLYERKGKYEEAEPLAKRVLAIRERVLGPEHPGTATGLNDLAWLYQCQGKYEQAEPLMQRALAIREKVLGPEHPDTATSFNDLGWLYQCQSKYEQAEPRIKRALAIREKVLGPENTNTATSLNNLAMLYYRQSKYEQAEPLMQRALAIWERALGPENVNTAIAFNDLINRSIISVRPQ